MIDQTEFRESVRSFLPDIARLTENNDHLEARIILASILKHDRAEKVFRGLRQIHEVECEMTEEMLAIERKWTKMLLKWVSIHHPNLIGPIRRSL